MVENYEKFNSIEDLYKHLLPAINTKLNELRRMKLYNITNLDIWNYCVKNKWHNKKDLQIYEMVNDILNIDELNIEMFVKKNGRNL